MSAHDIVNLLKDHAISMTRRQLLGRAGIGLGSVALGSLLGSDLQADTASEKSGLPHFPAKVKRIIYLFQNGAPSHVDLFDYKPRLQEMHGTQIPDEVVGGKRFSTMTGGQTARPCLSAITKFAKRGQSGTWIAEDFLPHTAEIVDQLCFVKSMHTTQVNHAPAIT